MKFADWSGLFLPTVSPAELVFRGAVMYLSIYVILRVMLRREMATMTTPDLLMVVLLADAAQNAMSGGYKSITDGLILVTTIIFCNYLLDRLAFHFPLIGRWVHPPPLPLIKHGRLLPRNMRVEYISVEELLSQLREQGIERIDEVKLAQMEGDGRISIIRVKKPRPHRRANQRKRE